MTRSFTRRFALLGVLLLGALLLTVAGCKSSSKTKATPTPVEFKATSLDVLKSYRFTSDIMVSAEALDPQSAQALLQGGTFRLKASGVRVNPDRQQTNLDADLGFLKAKLETVSIAKDTWSRQPDGKWQSGIQGPASLLATSDFSPQGMFFSAAGPTSEQLTQRLLGRPFTNDELNGVRARHYVFDRKGFEEVFGTQSAVPESAGDVKTQADVWFAEERGVLLRILITGTNTQQKEVLHLDVQISDIDSASNKVEPPI